MTFFVTAVDDETLSAKNDADVKTGISATHFFPKVLITASLMLGKRNAKIHYNTDPPHL